MKQIEKEIVALHLINKTFYSIDVDEIRVKSGVKITLKALIMYLELINYKAQAVKLHSVLTNYLGEEALDLVVIDLDRDTRSYSNEYLTSVLRAAKSNADSDEYIKSFILSNTLRRNDLERAVRNKMLENFVEITGCTKTVARYIRADLSRERYNVSVSTVADISVFKDAIYAYKAHTSDNSLNTYSPMALRIPELNINLRFHIA